MELNTTKEESIFSLLYQECLKPDETTVEVYDLLQFLQKLQHGEETFDSHESVSIILIKTVLFVYTFEICLDYHHVSSMGANRVIV